MYIHRCSKNNSKFWEFKNVHYLLFLFLSSNYTRVKKKDAKIIFFFLFDLVTTNWPVDSLHSQGIFFFKLAIVGQYIATGVIISEKIRSVRTLLLLSRFSFCSKFKNQLKKFLNLQRIHMRNQKYLSLFLSSGRNNTKVL